MTAQEQPNADPLVEATTAFQEAQKAEKRAKERLRTAQAGHRQAWAALASRRTDLAKVIADEARKGRRNRDIRLVTRYTPERIRQICRAHGVEPTE